MGEGDGTKQGRLLTTLLQVPAEVTAKVRDIFFVGAIYPHMLASVFGSTNYLTHMNKPGRGFGYGLRKTFQRQTIHLP